MYPNRESFIEIVRLKLASYIENCRNRIWPDNSGRIMLTGYPAGSESLKKPDIRDPAKTLIRWNPTMS